jgi:SAM-dependent methyltransferase
MNRKDRRAAQKTRTPAETAGALFAQGAAAQNAGDLDGAVRLYKRGLVLDAGNPAALNNLGAALLALGRLPEASERFRQAVLLQPAALDDFAALAGALTRLCPPLAAAAARAEQGWPERLPIEALFDADGFDAAATDPLFETILQTTTVRTVGYERLLTMLRHALLRAALATAPDARPPEQLAFWCALAQQCFINEYVFEVSSDEDEDVAALRARLDAAITDGTATPAAWLVALASYVPLASLAGADQLAARKGPEPVRALIRQQIEEPAQERALKSSLKTLRPIDDETSLRVQAQYEESPYPRWVLADPYLKPAAIDDHLRATYPHAQFRPLGERDRLDILVAGCGTGRHAIGLARTYKNPRMLAVDLSATSLAYAMRKTPAVLRSVIDYAQADILKLSSLDRRFDLIETRGVLHHMRDPFEGWRALLPLLKPGGIMTVGLYSELARADIVAARAFIAAEGFPPTPDGIRRCRQTMLAHPRFKAFARLGDFYSTSDCRDLLFHAQECRLTIPQIQDFLAAQQLTFIGFEFAPQTVQALRAAFAQAGRSINNLDHWHAYETEHPDTFRAMYQFAVQKA